MKSLFPTSSKSVEKIRFGEEHMCDVYTWTSPEGIKIATHMIMPCPQCGYPLKMTTSEFDFEDNTLGHRLKCPARWKKTKIESVGELDLRISELNEKGKPIYERCGWRGYIIKGSIVDE